MEKTSDSNGKQKVRSAEVGTDILKALAELSPSTSLSRLAEHVQMPASKVHRYLQALIASGFAEQNAATNHYGLGREALRVGLAALNSMDVLKVAALPLAELRDDLNETCFLAVWGNQGATVVHIEPAVRAVTVNTNWARCCRCSARRPDWCSAPICRNEKPWTCASRNCATLLPMRWRTIRRMPRCANRSVSAVCIMSMVC